MGNHEGRKRGLDGKEESEMRQRGSDSSGFSPEQIQLELSLLALDRQKLRDAGSTCEVLESNRLAIGLCQYELSRALIRRQLGHPVERAA